MSAYRSAWLFALFALVITISIYLSGMKSFDQDVYTRLNLVDQLQHGVGWYDNTLPRDNPQHPETTQWSRLLDALILGGGLILGKLIGIKAGIFWWAAIISPLCLALGCLVIVWAGKPVLSSRERILSSLFYILQPSIVIYSMFARPDHHGLLILLMMLSLGGMTKLLAENTVRPTSALLASLSQSLAMAISIEALISTGISYLVFGILWLTGTPHAAKKALWYSAGIAIWSLLLYLVHVPPQRWNFQELDRFSLVHLTVFISVWLFWLLASRLSLPSLKQKIAFGLCGGFIVFGIAELLNPQFILGPTANIDPILVKMWFNHIQEYQHLYSPWSDLPGQLALWLFPAIFGIPRSIHKIRKTSDPHTRSIWIYLLAINLVFALLAIAQARWILYSEAVALIPFVGFIYFLIDHLCRRVRKNFYPLVRCVVIICFAVGNFALGVLLTPKNSPSLAKHNTKNQIPELCDWMNAQPFANSPQVIAASCNYGTEIVYRTPFSVIATGSHRNADGILYVYHLFTNEDLDSARQQLLAKHITLVLINLKTSDITVSDKSFYNLLKIGQLPPWIKQLPLPADLAENFALFQFSP
ncbi:MAG: hypothetical protein LBH01_05935 [Verrucomicrobiales bacterium]|jgi:hypothetical protein|nr:hypothetical protein [Verrucomicrobiales bacterium]